MASYDQNLRNSVGFEGDESHLGASVQSTPPSPVQMFCLHIMMTVAMERRAS